MNFNIRKCTVLQCYRTNSPILATYSLAGQILECARTLLLGYYLRPTNDIYFIQLTHIVSKASKVLNFLKQNKKLIIDKNHCLYQFDLTHPGVCQLSMGSMPVYNKIYIIDRIQHRAARWSLCNYDRYSSVTLMQHQLNWQNLQERWKIARLSLLHKASYDHIACQVPPYCTLSHSNIRANHQFSFLHSSAKKMSTSTVSTLKLSNIGTIFYQT